MNPHTLAVAAAALREELMEHERLLHFPTPGTAREVFEARVIDGYWEVGASGGRFDTEVIWDVVRRRAAGDPTAFAVATSDATATSAGVGGPEPAWVTAEEELRELAPGVYLLTYLLTQGERRTRRATIWRRHGSGADDAGPGWVAAYHQGTIVTGRC